MLENAEERAINLGYRCAAVAEVEVLTLEQRGLVMIALEGAHKCEVKAAFLVYLVNANKLGFKIKH